MGGSNPYTKDAAPSLPKKAYQLTILPAGVTIQVDPARIPYSRTGHKGSILEIALGNDVEIDHACGGVCACSTCHIVVKQGLESCSPATEDEEDQIDNARGVTRQSRLACQCVPDGSSDVVVEVPAWNRNLVREGPH
jgi:2Fe-2S ferredoxin